MMRREHQAGEVREIRVDGMQLPRSKTTKAATFSKSQARPNEKLCACNGCLERSGLCRSIWFDQAPSSRGCAQRNGLWCIDKRTPLWEAPDIGCELAKRTNYINTTLTTLEVTLTALPGKGFNNVKFQMADNDAGNSLIALLPCSDDIPQTLLDRNATSVLVQGYYQQDGQAVRPFLALEDIPTDFRQNVTFFIILNVQDTAKLSSDVEKKTESQIVTSSMAGTLREHWSPDMSIAVVFVTCPGTSLNADPEKVRRAFFTDFANAIAAVSRGQIKVRGNLTDIVIECPANTSKGDVFSYYQAVNAGLKSNPTWDSKYKAMVLPNGWMSAYGLAYSPGTLSWYSDLGAQDATNIMHEMGHNFGLDHAAIIPSNNPTGYDAYGDCSSAMSKCGKVMVYTLASNWFLGFNSFQYQISLDDITSPVSFKINSPTDREASGILLTKKDNGTDVPAFTVSYLRKADVDPALKSEMRNWVGKVHVHELPSTVYGPTKSIAILNMNKHTAYRIRQFSVAVAVTFQTPDTATVFFCKANSKEESETCGK